MQEVFICRSNIELFEHANAVIFPLSVTFREYSRLREVISLEFTRSSSEKNMLVLGGSEALTWRLAGVSLATAY